MEFLKEFIKEFGFLKEKPMESVNALAESISNRTFVGTAIGKDSIKI